MLLIAGINWERFWNKRIISISEDDFKITTVKRCDRYTGYKRKKIDNFNDVIPMKLVKPELVMTSTNLFQKPTGNKNI